MLKKMITAISCQATKEELRKISLRTNVNRKNLIARVLVSISTDCLESKTCFTCTTFVVPKYIFFHMSSLVILLSNYDYIITKYDLSRSLSYTTAHHKGNCVTEIKDVLYYPKKGSDRRRGI